MRPKEPPPDPVKVDLWNFRKKGLLGEKKPAGNVVVTKKDADGVFFLSI